MSTAGGIKLATRLMPTVAAKKGQRGESEVKAQIINPGQQNIGGVGQRFAKYHQRCLQ